MFVAKVIGAVVATQKEASLVGARLYTVEPMRIHPEDRNRLVGTGRTFVAVDVVGAGEGQLVLIVQGSSARFTAATEKLPIDAAIIGLVDQMIVEGQKIPLP